MILLNHTSKSSFDFHYIQPHLLSNAHHPQHYGKLFYFRFFFFSCLHFYSKIATIGCHHNHNYSCHWYVLHVFLLLLNICILLDYVTTHDHCYIEFHPEHSLLFSDVLCSHMTSFHAFCPNSPLRNSNTLWSL